MADEREIALGVMKLAAERADGLCTFQQAYQDIPDYVMLSGDNLAQSTTRPNEPMWHQIVRNIKSHDKLPGNFILDGYLVHVPNVGYEITDAGRHYLSRR